MHPNVKRLLDKEYDEQRSEAWLKLRGNMLTASDAASAIGTNSYQTPDDLLLKKCGLGEKFTGNEATEWGTKMEPVAIEMFEEQSGEKVNELGLIPHPEHSWLGGSPDGLTDSNCLVEIKCPMRRKIIPGQVPLHYQAQIQLCMEIMDVESCFFVQYAPIEISWPNEAVFDVTVVPRDREWFAKYLPVMKAFWDKVLYFREHIDELPKPKEKKKRKKKEVPPPTCQVQELSEEDVYNDY
jgi:putative phage-type endonuclease|tara:strand:+ start:905 stop:1621 length:717 start_codon:yes stop_codon:yes gene_type:complete